MRALEDALAIAQAAESSQPHPLLVVELEESEIDISMTVDDDEAFSAESVTESFGTLHIDGKERTVRYFGTSGGSEVRRLSLCLRSPLTKVYRVY